MRAGQLPSFLLIGTNKAGTSTLYHVLKTHPQVFLPYKKELHFFNDDTNYAKGAGWYAESFFSGAEGALASGDITPNYLYFGDKVIPRITATYGDAPPRMLVILRDPVARAYSRYWHHRRVDGREPLSFEGVLAAEAERLRADVAGDGARGRFPLAYFRGGLYGEQLERYFAAFPRECFHVMLFDDLQRDFDGTVRDLLAFLGVDATVALEQVRANPASVTRAAGLDSWLRSRSLAGRFVKGVLPDAALSRVRKLFRRLFLRPFTYPPMNPATEQALRARYLPDVLKLEALIGRDLSTWYPREATRDDIRS